MTSIFSGVEDLAEGANLAGLSRAEVRALATRTYRWESLLDDDTAASDGVSASTAQEGTSHELNCHDAAGSSNGSCASELRDRDPARRGMVRQIYILVDMTEAMKQSDYKPRRFEFVMGAASHFFERFLAENPLGSLGLAVLRSGTCEAMTPFTNSADVLQQKLQEASKLGPQGRLSIVHGLTLALRALEGSPAYTTREVLFLLASLSTHDPQEISLDSVLRSLQETRVSVSVLSMSPELFVLKQICSKTKGNCSVALDSGHFSDMLDGHIAPPICEVSVGAAPELILMGFPRKGGQSDRTSRNVSKREQPWQEFTCPRCHATVRDVPGSCPVCDLPLTSSLLLARSFQHLFPMPPWVRTVSGQGSFLCCGCTQPLDAVGTSSGSCSKCQICQSLFCEACAQFCRATLRKCPQCMEAPLKKLRT